MTKHDLAVIGGGLAGLIAARAWRQTGGTIAVFDKGRGPGGRMSTRRSGPFDHGAQYFTARGPQFIEEVDAWRAARTAALWTPQLAEFDARGLRAKTNATLRYVGSPTMNAALAPLAAALEVRFGVRITGVTRGPDGFELRADDEIVARSRRLIIAVPAPQAADLLTELAPTLAARCRAVTMAPCWAAMLRFASPVASPFDGIFVNHGPLSWAARDSSKPGRPPGERWVVHASAAWTAAHLEDDPDAVTRALQDALVDVTGPPLPELQCAAAHRWRYALCQEPLNVGALVDEQMPGLAVAGDWCAGSRVEGAFDSGLAAAQRLARA